LQLSDSQGNVISIVTSSLVVFVQITSGGVIVENQLTGITSKVVDINGTVVFSGLAVPYLTGHHFRLRFTLPHEAAGVFMASNSDEFSLGPVHLMLNDTQPHAQSGMPLPGVSVSLTNREGKIKDHYFQQRAIRDLQNTITISVDLLTLRYIGCYALNLSYMISKNLFSNVSECARVSASAGASFFYINSDSPGLCGYGGNLSQGCLNDTCWEGMPSVPIPRTLEYDMCNSSFDFRFFAFQNSSSLLVGKRTSLSPSGQAVFNDLKIPNFYGRASCMLLFYDDRDDVLVTGGKALIATKLFDVDPLRLTFRGPAMPTILELPSLRNLTVAITDFNGTDLSPFYMYQKYTLIATLMHNGIEMPSNILRGQTVVESVKHKVNFELELSNMAGWNFTIRFTCRGLRTLLVTTTSEFSPLPSFLMMESSDVLIGQMDSVLPSISVSSRDRLQQIMTTIILQHKLFIEMSVYRNQTQIMSCSSSQSRDCVYRWPTCRKSECVNGTTVQMVQNGLVHFTDIVILDLAGKDFQYKFTLQGRSELRLISSSFVVYPGALKIAEGQTAFDGIVWHINNAMSVYSLRLLRKNGTALADDGDDFNITVSLLKKGRDLSTFLTGQRWAVTQYSASTGVHASFTNLIVGAAGSGMVLRFAFATLSLSLSMPSLEASTRPFDAVPDSLRLLDLNGKLTSVLDFGPFFRGRTPVHFLKIAALDINAAVQTTIQETDGYTVALKGFFDNQTRTSFFSGKTSSLIINGTATFDDLVLDTFDECQTFPCSLLLRFEFQISNRSFNCSEVWCTNLTMHVRQAPVVKPHKLRLHPLFPTCAFPTCSDWKVTGNEKCDDGNNEDGDGCSANCSTVEEGWECNSTVCGSWPTSQEKRIGSVCKRVCGNGIVNTGEECDDGNTLNGDGCDSSCAHEGL
jgi:cysteine-rich repeat protein